MSITQGSVDGRHRSVTDPLGAVGRCTRRRWRADAAACPIRLARLVPAA